MAELYESFVHFIVAVAQSSSDVIEIRYIL